MGYGVRNDERRKVVGAPFEEAERKRERKSARDGVSIHFQRYREWLQRFFTKLIECSPPLRTVRQLPVELSSAERIDAPSAAADNIKSAPIWQNSRSRNGTN